MKTFGGFEDYFYLCHWQTIIYIDMASQDMMES
jgi:hypothetical protein